MRWQRVGGGVSRALMLSVAIAIGVSQPANAMPPRVAIPDRVAFNRDAPDPDIVRDGDTFYAFTTGTTWGNNLGVVRASESPSGTWRTNNGQTYGSAALPRRPNWVAESVAPGVIQLQNRWVMYYAARPVVGVHWCLSIATASAPDASFVDRSKSCFLADTANGGVIDPDPFLDDQGRPWLAYKTADGVSGEAAGLWTVPLSADGLRIDGLPTRVLRQDDVPFNVFETIENPQMVSVNGEWYLFFSHGRWDSDGYKVAYAQCASATGPCIAAPQPLITSRAGARGPGGASLVSDANGDWWMAYHAWTTSCTSYSCGGARKLFVTRVSFDQRIPCDAPEVPDGYRFVARDGGVFTFGNLPFCGGLGGVSLAVPVSGMASTGSGGGYWLYSADGGVDPFGDARNFGAMRGTPLNQPIVTMRATPDAGGYWLVASDGGVFSFGNARFYGSTGSIALNRPIVTMASTPSGNGYWLVASDGGVFCFGDAQFYGSTGAMRLNQPVVGMAPTPTAGGYWLVASDGGIFSFGDAQFYGSTGSIVLNQPIVGMTASPTGAGYWFVASDGGIFSFGDAPFRGSTGSIVLNAPITGMAGR